MPLRRTFTGLVTFLALGAIVACADQPAVTATTTQLNTGTSSEAAPGAPSTADLSVIAAGTALPGGYKIDSDRTMIFGTDENWTGRLSYTTSTAADQVFDFLHREMPNFGWTEISAMRSDVSLLTFTSSGSGRMATVHITRGSTLGGTTRVDMVVSPQSGRGSR